MISFETDPRYLLSSLLEKSAPVFPTKMKSIYFSYSVMVYSLIISAVLIPTSLWRILISLTSSHSFSPSSYNTISCTFLASILSYSQIITVILSAGYFNLQIKPSASILLSEPSIHTANLYTPSGLSFLNLWSLIIKIGLSLWIDRCYTAEPITVGSSFIPFLPWKPTTVISDSTSLPMAYNSSLVVNSSSILCLE